MAAFSLVLASNSVWLFGGRLFDVLPANNHPMLYSLLLVNTGIAVFSIVCLQIMAASFAADILDELEFQTGKRQEGVIFAVGAFLSKATIGAGALIAGVVIQWVGIQSDSLPGQVPADVLQSLGWFTLIIVAGFSMLGFGFTTQFRLNRDDHAKLRKTLDATS